MDVPEITLTWKKPQTIFVNWLIAD